MTQRDRREYHRALRATPGYSELQRLKEKARRLDLDYLKKELERERLRGVKRRAEQREQINERARKRHTKRMTEDPSYRDSKAAHALKWIKSNPAKAVANVMRREAMKLRAIPAWADLEKIKLIYEESAIYRASGIDCEVDHIVPLRSPYVCGLHVPENLQLLDSLSNRAKGNRRWPGQ